MRIVGLFLIPLLVFLSHPAVGHSMDESPSQMCFVNTLWQEISYVDGITVYSQKLLDFEVLAFKAEGILEAPIEQVMEVLRKVEISKDWMPDISEKYTVKDLSDYEAITYSVNELPWPFADRELLLHNKLSIDREDNYLVVDVYSIDRKSHPVQSENVRAQMKCGRTRIRPAGNRQTEIELTIFVDPAGDIPVWLVNLLQRSMPLEFLKELEKKAQTTNYALRPVFRAVLNELIALIDQQTVGSR